MHTLTPSLPLSLPGSSRFPRPEAPGAWRDPLIRKDCVIDAPDLAFMARLASIIEGITTDAIVPLIQAPGIRRKWDPVRA